MRLQLTPMQLPQAVPTSGLAMTVNLATNSSTATSSDLLLHPGEPSEMFVHLENQGTRILQLRMQLEGDIPWNWCRINIDGNELAPGQKIDARLQFEVPANFFEEMGGNNSPGSLALDYPGRINIYYQEIGTGRQLIESAAFNLYVRPRSLYTDFLPALYSEVDFIARFLKIFEDAFEPAVQTMDMLWAYLDPLTAPEAMLPFLAHWVAWEIDPRWSTERSRRLIRQAMEIYRWRGTRRGLRFYLHLYTDLPLDEHIPEETDKHISIKEVFGEGFKLGATAMGENSIVGGGRPFHFIVRLRPDPGMQVSEQLVRYIIDQEKPAFCTYELYIQ